MPLSKERNRKRMKLVRLHKAMVKPAVQPKPIFVKLNLDANGNVIPEYY